MAFSARTAKALAISAGIIGAAAVSASALQVSIDAEGQPQILIADNGAGDIDPTTGFVIFNGSAGTAANPINPLRILAGRCTLCAATLTLDANLTAPSGTTQSVVVKVSDVDFILDDTLGWDAIFQASSDFPSGVTGKATAWWSPTNTYFAQTYQIGDDFLPIGPGAEAINFADFFPAPVTASPYSMTLVMEFDATGQVFTANMDSVARMNAVPVPAALPLLAGALALLGVARVRRATA